MKILIVGRDGRSYSLGKRLAEEGNELFFAPGNGACWQFGECWSEDIDDPTTTDKEIVELSVAEIVHNAKREKIEFVIITSIEASMAGLSDALRNAGFCVFGTGISGTELEAHREIGSKVCFEHGISIPDWIFCSCVEEAIETVKDLKQAFVIKSNVLMGGKNVVVCDSWEETVFMLEHYSNVLGDLILQEKVEGVEVSAMVAVCGKDAEIVGLTTVFEHKRVNDGDLGTLCAEMGSLLLAGISTRMKNEFEKLRPYLRKVGYEGILDMNYILDRKTGELKMLEFTARFGDPTTEIMIPLFGGRITDLFYDWANGKATEPEFVNACGVGVVLAGGGYPYDNQVIQGLPIMFLESEKNIDCMMAVLDIDGKAYTKGGRHLIALGQGNSVDEARSKAYWSVRNVKFPDMFYRTDIGRKWSAGEKEVCLQYGVVEEGMGGFKGWERR